MQVSETLIYDEKSFQIKTFSDGDPFDLQSMGLNPIPASSACWQGYSCTYEIKDYRLYLQYIIVNHSNDMKSPSKTPPPPINDINSSISNYAHIGYWEYSNINLLVNYNGEILIANNLKSNARRSSLPPRLYQYDTIYKLSFTNGVLLDSKNITKDLI